MHKTLGVPYRLHIAHDRRTQNEAVTLIFWHGIAASSTIWNKVFNALSENQAFDRARIITMDLLGFGESPAPDWSNYTTDDHLRSLHRTLRNLDIKTPVILVGHSMGSLLAVQYTTSHPKNIVALALVSPPFLRPTESQILFDRLYRKAYNKLLREIKVKHLDQIASFFEGIGGLESDAVGQEAFRYSMQHVVLNGRAFTQLKRLRMPIHIFHGSLDFLVNGANVAYLSKRKNVTLHTAPTGHDIVGQKKQQLIETLEELITEQKWRNQRGSNPRHQA